MIIKRLDPRTFETREIAKHWANWTRSKTAVYKIIKSGRKFRIQDIINKQ